MFKLKVKVAIKKTKTIQESRCPYFYEFAQKNL